MIPAPPKSQLKINWSKSGSKLEISEPKRPLLNISGTSKPPRRANFQHSPRYYRVATASKTTPIHTNKHGLDYAERTKIPAEAGIFKKRGDHLLSPFDYHRPYRLNYRVRNGNGCIPARIITATRMLPREPPTSSRPPPTPEIVFAMLGKSGQAYPTHVQL